MRPAQTVGGRARAKCVDGHRLKALVLDSVSSLITKRVLRLVTDRHQGQISNGFGRSFRRPSHPFDAVQSARPRSYSLLAAAQTPRSEVHEVQRPRSARDQLGRTRGRSDLVQSDAVATDRGQPDIVIS